MRKRRGEDYAVRHAHGKNHTINIFKDNCCLFNWLLLKLNSSEIVPLNKGLLKMHPDFDEPLEDFKKYM